MFQPVLTTARRPLLSDHDILWNEQRGLCFYCEVQMEHKRHRPQVEGLKVPLNSSTIEHLQTRASGGSNHFSNKKLACFECNCTRGKTPWQEYRKLKAPKKVYIMDGNPALFTQGETYMQCILDACSRPAVKKGMCNAHYLRNWRHGDPRGGRKSTIAGEPAAWLGKVALTYEGDDCLAWPFYTRPDGYGEVRYDGKNWVVSRLVCEMVNGPAPSPHHEAAHSCGKGHEGCVAKAHLRWATHKENHDDRKQHGTDGFAVWARWKAEGTR